MIKQYENPEGIDAKTNKFIASNGDGLRGQLLALSQDQKEGIILSHTTSIAGAVKWGRMYHVKEVDPGQYPLAIKEVSQIPTGFCAVFP